MMKYVYHGSSVKNLKAIKPINKFVYATPVREIAIIFISPLGSDLYYSLFGDGVDYPIELVERKAGMFKKIFNCSGYIYKLNSVNFTSEFTAWTAELVSMNEEKVISCEYIDNVYSNRIVDGKSINGQLGYIYINDNNIKINIITIYIISSNRICNIYQHGYSSIHKYSITICCINSNWNNTIRSNNRLCNINNNKI